MVADISPCGVCGTALASSEAEGLCPRCLMELAVVDGRVADLPALIAAGDRVGPYEIVSLIGRGGMGEVYRAVDTRLDRTVAIKLLSPSIVENVSRRDRFEREARAVSSLNHPHICALYDVGERDDTPFLVMEHVEGETLAERLERGALPTNDVLRYSIEIAGALEHAHAHGIIHRDLKPANVMLTPVGVKLLDFGVAKLKGQSPIGGGGPRTLDPSLPTITEDGTVIGTLQYMSPEQLDARDADPRTDIFAFGAVMYEMATGKHPFSGPNRAGVTEAIRNRDPAPCSRVNPDTPVVLDQIVSRCLAKNAADRWQTARDVKHALAQMADAGARISGLDSSAAAPRLARSLSAAGAIAAIAILTAIALDVTHSRRLPPDTRALRFIVLPPENGSFNQSSAFMAVSPDGHSLAFVASSREGRNTLWVHSLDSLKARPLPGTDDAGQPFWSPDGRFLAFGRTSGPDTLSTIDVARGFTEAIAGTRAAPGAWNEDDVILFPGGRQQGLYRASARGGSARPVTSLDPTRAEISHAWPQFLPDGRHFIFLARSANPEHDGVVYAGSLDSPDRVRLVRANSQAVYAPQGYLLFMQVNTLVAQAFDPARLQASGEPIPIAEQVERTPGTFRGAFSVSRTGVLAYRPIRETALAWYDRAGRQLQSIGPPGHYSNPAASPDEQRLAVARLDLGTGASEIWAMDLVRGGLGSRLTSDTATADMPLWRPDGSRILFSTPSGLFERASDGALPALLLLKGRAVGRAQAWSHDGDSLIYDVRHRETGLDVWMLPTVGNRTPVPLLQTEFQEGYARLSPDGRWMAYVSDESGKYEVYARAFPSGEKKRQISTQGGLEPAWSADGSELFYLAPDRSLMSVVVRAGPTFEADSPTRLFETRMSVVFNPTYTRNQYVVSRDGQRFLINQTTPAAPPSPITVVVNWQAALTQ